MKLSQKKIDTIIAQVVGRDAVELVHYLKDKKNISEFDIAKDIELEVNTIRNILYRLYESNLVSFIRKKDKVKGWYIYYWTFNPKHLPYLEFDVKKKRLERLKDRLKRETSTDFYACINKCIRLNFEQTMEFEYKCPECGELLNPEDNSTQVKEIEKEIKVLEKELK